jgi:hypothetical protein
MAWPPRSSGQEAAGVVATGAAPAWCPHRGRCSATRRPAPGSAKSASGSRVPGHPVLPDADARGAEPAHRQRPAPCGPRDPNRRVERRCWRPTSVITSPPCSSSCHPRWRWRSSRSSWAGSASRWDAPSRPTTRACPSSTATRSWISCAARYSRASSLTFPRPASTPLAGPVIDHAAVEGCLQLLAEHLTAVDRHPRGLRRPTSGGSQSGAARLAAAGAAGRGEPAGHRCGQPESRCGSRYSTSSNGATPPASATGSRPVPARRRPRPVPGDGPGP